MNVYTSYRNYSLEYDLDSHILRIGAGKKGWFTVKLCEARFCGEKVFDLSDYAHCTARVDTEFDRQVMHVMYDHGPVEQEEMEIIVTASASGVEYRMDIKGHFNVHFCGEMDFGSEARPVCFDRRGMDLRAAYGPAASIVDNALFDYQTDSAIEVKGPSFRMKYSWHKKHFSHTMQTGGDDVERGFSLRLHENVYERKFGIPYAPMNHNTCYPSPPVGWMTWYAVQFDASEKIVLENARFQKEHLTPYGANTIWIDWEWYHQDFSGTHRPGVDVFHPDPIRYPNGLKYVADEIRALGLIPALWIGATNDPNKNEFLEENPDALLVQKRGWCGQYFIDPTHPKVKSEYIPRVFKQIVDMGYEALKWDCLPITFERVDTNHDMLYDSSISTDEAIRELVKIARDTVGKNFYMLSCSGHTLRDMLFAGDIFDAARIGGDIFRWSEFVTSGVDRILHMYPYHNTLLYADPDNVVIRPKYNTFDQAISRVSIVSILGLPFTLGDNLPDLDADRLSMIQHAIPVLDIHPMDIRQNLGDHRQLIINLAIATEAEDYNVIDILNLLESDNTIRISLENDLHLETRNNEKYLLFDFWNKRYLGETDNEFALTLEPCASRVVAVRRKTGLPQILSTSRHLSQGALELHNVTYDQESMVLSGVSDVIAGDDYNIYVYVPEGLRVFYESDNTSMFGIERIDVTGNLSYETQCDHGSVWKLPVHSNESKLEKWSVAFVRCHPV